MKFERSGPLNLHSFFKKQAGKKEGRRKGARQIMLPFHRACLWTKD
jgi:hypothetical protein